MNDELTPLMTRLPDPAPPPTLTATVMARIAREEEARHAAVIEPVRRERPAWPWALVGIAVVIGASAWGWLAAGTVPDLISPRIGTGAPLLTPGGPAAVGITLGLLVYLAGLFAPLRHRGR